MDDSKIAEQILKLMIGKNQAQMKSILADLIRTIDYVEIKQMILDDVRAEFRKK